MDDKIKCMKKLKVAFFSLTCDEGCSINFLELLNSKYKDWKDFIEFKAFRLLQSKEDISDIDVAFVEGAVSTDKEKRRLETIRNASKKLVAVGSCAISGSPSNARNFFDSETVEEIKPVLEKFGHIDKVLAVKDVVNVDEEVPGCPMLENKMVEIVEKYLKDFGVSNA
jgi:coenzyme F420-reducing hydrogenase gamma subunit